MESLQTLRRLESRGRHVLSIVMEGGEQEEGGEQKQQQGKPQNHLQSPSHLEDGVVYEAGEESVNASMTLPATFSPHARARRHRLSQDKFKNRAPLQYSPSLSAIQPKDLPVPPVLSPASNNSRIVDSHFDYPSEERIDVLRKLFREADVDRTGYLSVQSLGKLVEELFSGSRVIGTMGGFKHVGRKVSTLHAQRIMDQIDNDEDGMLDFHDFCIAFGCLVNDDGEGNPDMETNILAADNRALVMEEKDLQQQILANNHLFEKQTAALNKRIEELREERIKAEREVEQIESNFAHIAREKDREVEELENLLRQAGAEIDELRKELETRSETSGKEKKEETEDEDEQSQPPASRKQSKASIDLLPRTFVRQNTADFNLREFRPTTYDPEQVLLKNDQMKTMLQELRRKLEETEQELGSTRLRCSELETELSNQQVLFSHLNGHCLRLQREIDDLNMHNTSDNGFGRRGSRGFLGSATDSSILDEIAIEELRRERDEWKIRAINAEARSGSGGNGSEAATASAHMSNGGHHGASLEVRGGSRLDRVPTDASVFNHSEHDSSEGKTPPAEEEEEEEEEAEEAEALAAAAAEEQKRLNDEIERLMAQLQEERSSMANERSAVEARAAAHEKAISILRQQLADEQRARLHVQGDKAKLNDEVVSNNVNLKHYLDVIAQLEDRVRGLQDTVEAGDLERYNLAQAAEDSEERWKKLDASNMQKLAVLGREVERLQAQLREQTAASSPVPTPAALSAASSMQRLQAPAATRSPLVPQSPGAAEGLGVSSHSAVDQQEREQERREHARKIQEMREREQRLREQMMHLMQRQQHAADANTTSWSRVLAEVGSIRSSVASMHAGGSGAQRAVLEMRQSCRKHEVHLDRISRLCGDVDQKQQSLGPRQQMHPLAYAEDIYDDIPLRQRRSSFLRR